jgi:hypothetical protein
MVIVLLVLMVAAVIGYLVWSNTEVPPVGPPPTEAELMQARLDIYRVSRGVDASLAGQEACREAERTKQAIADALDDRA